MKQVLGFILFPVSLILFCVTALIGFPFEIVYMFWHHHIDIAVINLSQRLYSMAFAVDVFANAMFPSLWTFLFVKKDHIHKFGQRGETISYVLGKNQIGGTLSRFGVEVKDELKEITKKEHCLLAVEQYENPLAF